MIKRILLLILCVCGWLLAGLEIAIGISGLGQMEASLCCSLVMCGILTCLMSTSVCRAANLPEI